MASYDHDDAMAILTSLMETHTVRCACHDKEILHVSRALENMTLRCMADHIPMPLDSDEKTTIIVKAFEKEENCPRCRGHAIVESDSEMTDAPEDTEMADAPEEVEDVEMAEAPPMVVELAATATMVTVTQPLNGNSTRRLQIRLGANGQFRVYQTLETKVSSATR